MVYIIIYKNSDLKGFLECNDDIELQQNCMDLVSKDIEILRIVGGEEMAVDISSSFSITTAFTGKTIIGRINRVTSANLKCKDTSELLYSDDYNEESDIELVDREDIEDEDSDDTPGMDWDETEPDFSDLEDTLLENNRQTELEELDKDVMSTLRTKLKKKSLREQLENNKITQIKTPKKVSKSDMVVNPNEEVQDLRNLSSETGKTTLDLIKEKGINIAATHSVTHRG